MENEEQRLGGAHFFDVEMLYADLDGMEPFRMRI